MTPPAVPVLQVLGALEGGGVQSVVLKLLRHLNRGLFASDVCVLAAEPGPLTADAEALGARVICCPPRQPLSFAGSFRVLVREGRYGIVHVHRSSSMQGLAIALAAGAGAPVRIAHYHNTFRPDGFSPRGLATPFLRALVKRHASAVLGVSRPVLASHFGPEWNRDPRFEVLPNGIELDRFHGADRAAARASLGVPPDALVIGHTGRFAPAKNHSALIEAAAIVVRQCPRAHFLLIGDGALRPEIEGAIAAARLAPHFTLAGWREDTARLYAAMDIFFFPSLWEGFGLVLAEAQAAGLPCVASDLECFEEVLTSALQRLRFPARNAEAAAASLLALAADEALRHRLGAEAAGFVRDHFEIGTIARRLEAIYRRLLADTRRD